MVEIKMCVYFDIIANSSNRRLTSFYFHFPSISQVQMHYFIEGGVCVNNVQYSIP